MIFFGHFKLLNSGVVCCLVTDNQDVHQPCRNKHHLHFSNGETEGSEVGSSLPLLTEQVKVGFRLKSVYICSPHYFIH